MNRFIKNIALFLILLPAVVFAQDDWEKPAGGIEDARVVIEKEKVINLRPVSRRFKSIQFEVPKAVPITLNYQLPEVKVELPSLQVIVRPKTMKTLPLDKLYSFNGKLGYGNYRTPLVLLNIGSKRSDEYMLDAYLNHISSGRGPDKIGNGLDSEYNTNIGGSGKYFLNNFTLQSGFNYRNYTYNIYGYDPDQMIASPESFFIRQNLNEFSFDIGLKDNNLKNDFDNELNFNLNYLVNNNNDPTEPLPRQEYNEFQYGIDYMFEANFDNHWSANATLGYIGYNYSNLADTIAGRSRRLAQLSPNITYRTGDIIASVGVNIYNENDPINSGESNFHVYPTASISYQLADNHTVTGRIGGVVEEMSVSRILNENPYINKNQQPNHNLNNFTGGAKLSGNILPNLDYQVEYELKHYSRMFFYLNNATDTARFDLTYDQGGVTINSMGIQLNYLLSDRLDISADATYYSYNTADLEEAWHKPTLSVNFRSDFRIMDRLSGSITYSLLDGIKAQTAAGDKLTLSTIHDINLGLNLVITERAGIFVDVLNMVNSNYQLYNNYPVKGIQLIGGVSFKF